MEPSLRTVDKAIDVLFHLHGEAAAQRVTDVARALGLPKASAHRLLASLARRGLVEQEAGGRYRPGIGLVALGLGALEREPVVVVGRPVLEAEAAALDETVFLVAPRAGRLLVLDKAEGTGFLRAAPQVGAEVPVHSTAVGKLFLAFAREIVPWPEGRLRRYTARTLTASSVLAREVELALERGFAESREEWIPGLAALAAPVLAGERMVAALAVAATTPRLEALGTDRVIRRTLAAAARIGARLEGAPDTPEPPGLRSQGGR